MVYFHTREGGWFYLGIGKWQPFAFLAHSGWVCLRMSWLKRYMVDRPLNRLNHTKGV